MGEHESFLQASGLLLNGILPNETSHVTRALDAERWSKVEGRDDEQIACIQPNQQSEECWNAVSNYVQTLIKKCFSCEVAMLSLHLVFTFGSVPLKTYLPVADIDLVVCSKTEDMKDTWASVVLKVLENEKRHIKNAKFRVKEVKYIDAKVRVIKCLVENIVVDISFNQIGWPFISQNHLFKRSIILIKAWCYYERRILGACFGLISTYTLEILVLYIFHVFNNSFAGSFEVLYRFLEVFSNFDWKNFCVSLWGPVPINSLPDTIAELPQKNGGKLLFDNAFLETFSIAYAVSLSANFYMIHSAFAFGAKKLANLLDCPKENLIAEVDRFFLNTWEYIEVAIDPMHLSLKFTARQPMPFMLTQEMLILCR
ncbi:hypothetical protein IEQ34_004019 [Dendrobium chrysotoxum]|uniref:Polymerase nucleotidyl transferase domain-containing protein n=1 Tax=Dendrobium chrysotoxum TaxID=161865 RepID=A0AAV7HCY4_DENCH|nr:hypothetical protein IEQ34_004019 [Dendrobium chrysotoxum]